MILEVYPAALMKDLPQKNGGMLLSSDIERISVVEN